MIFSSTENMTFCKFLTKDLDITIIQHRSSTNLNFISLNFNCISTSPSSMTKKGYRTFFLQDAVSANNSVKGKALFQTR